MELSNTIELKIPIEMKDLQLQNQKLFLNVPIAQSILREIAT